MSSLKPRAPLSQSGAEDRMSPRRSAVLVACVAVGAWVALFLILHYAVGIDLTF